MHDLTAVAIGAMGDQYPELRADADKIHSIIDAEEKNFADTLRAGTTLFNRAVRRTKETGGTVFSGADAFQLHDTYGFPIDLTLEMAAEHGLKVDEETFHQLMQRQRETAKRDAQAKKLGNADISVYGNLLETGGPTEFLGYTDSESEARVLGIIVNGESTGAARKGDQVELVLDRTPFYAESGGQLADKGTITVDGRGVVDVEDVQKPIQGLFVHRGTVREGEVVVDDTVHAAIDTGRRLRVPLALGDPPHPLCAAEHPRPVRRPGRVGEPAGTAALRLHLGQTARRYGNRPGRGGSQRGTRPQHRGPVPGDHP